jgi:hypothetical protein
MLRCRPLAAFSAHFETLAFAVIASRRPVYFTRQYHPPTALQRPFTTAYNVREHTSIQPHNCCMYGPNGPNMKAVTPFSRLVMCGLSAFQALLKFYYVNQTRLSASE